MSIFSKIYSFILVATVVLTTVGQVYTSSGNGQIFTHSKAAETHTYSGEKSQNIWGVINLDSSSSLFNIYSTYDSEEDRRNSSKSVASRESALTKVLSHYLLLARDIALSPSINDLLYPFHFYF